MKKALKIAAGVLISLSIIIILFTISNKKSSSSTGDFLVQRGRLEVLVSIPGQLQAENSELIQAPSELRSRNIRIETVRIQNLVPEGTVVNRGDWIATLDRSEADVSLKNMEDQVQEAEIQYIRTQLDTTITLRNLRDEITNLEYALEERVLTLEQSKFEPPATIRQAEIDLERAQRAIAQHRNNYVLRHRQAVESMSEAAINLEIRKRRYQELQNVLDNFIITAPRPGMVIYHREWNGRKREVGSVIHSRDLTVATLPDMSSMISRVNVNEIDIRKIKIGQNVRISVEAIPDSRYTGQVTQIANVGQQLPNTDTKVFEVLISLNENDEILRPAMTSSNVIVTDSFNDVLYIPIEAVQVEEGIPFVYTARGTRQIVLLGAANNNFIIVEQGLNEGDLIHMTSPENSGNYRRAGEELIALINAREEQNRLTEERRLTMQNSTPDSGSGRSSTQSIEEAIN